MADALVGAHAVPRPQEALEVVQHKLGKAANQYEGSYELGGVRSWRRRCSVQWKAETPGCQQPSLEVRAIG